MRSPPGSGDCVAVKFDCVRDGRLARPASDRVRERCPTSLNLSEPGPLPNGGPGCFMVSAPCINLARQPHRPAADDARARECPCAHPRPKRRERRVGDRADFSLGKQPLELSGCLGFVGRNCRRPLRSLGLTQSLERRSFLGGRFCHVGPSLIGWPGASTRKSPPRRI
jgi:hypothetical protein